MAEITEQEIKRLALKFSEVLAENDAELFDRQEATYVSLLGDAELPRTWPELSPDDIPDAVDYLNLVTSVKNKVSLRYVDDPKAGREIFNGRWRQAYIRRVVQGQVSKLVQVLRKGYAEEIKWDEARIKSKRNLQDQPTGDNPSIAEKYIEVIWPNCSIEKLDAMAASLSEKTYENPVIEGEERTGIWRNLLVGTQKSDDGSGIITLSLAISHFRLDSFTSWLTHRNFNVVYLWGYGKDEAQATINAWKAKGKSATVSYRAGDGLVDIVLRERDYDPLSVSSTTSAWDCRYKEISNYYFGVDDPELYPIDTTPADGVSYRRQLRDNGDGSWDITIITRNVQYRNVSFQTSGVAGDASVETRQQLGLTIETPEPVTSEAGKTKRQRVNVRDDCSKDVITDKDSGIAQTTTVKIISPSGSTTITEKTVQSSSLGNPSSEKGHIKRVENKDSKYPERYDTHEQDREPNDQTATSTDTSKAAVNSKTLHTENATPLTPESATKGTIYRQSSQPTEAGNNRTVEEVIVPTDQTATSTDTSKAAVNSKTLHTENATNLTVESIVKGIITRQDATPTEAGNQRTVVEIKVPTDQSSTTYDIKSSGKATKVFHSENDTPLEEPSLSQGIIIRQEVTPTEAGNDRTVEITEESSSMSAGFAALRSGAEEHDENIYRNMDNVLEAPYDVQGRIYRADNSLNDDYTYDGRLTDVHSQPRDITFRSIKTGESEVYTTEYKASRDLVFAPNNAQGIIYDSRMRLNDDDTYSGELKKREAISSSIATDIINTHLRSGSETVQKNVYSIPTPSGGIGATESYSARLNEDNTYDARLRRESAWPDSFKFTSLVSPSGKIEISSYLNKQTVVEAGITETNIGSYRVSNDENDDGTYDGDVIYSQPSDSKEISFSSLKNPLRESEQTSYQFARTKIDAPAAAIGHSYSADNRLQDDGTYDQDLVYNKGVEHETPLTTTEISDRTIGYEIGGRNFASIPTITDESASFKTVRMAIGVNNLGAYDYEVNKTFVRPKPTTAETTAEWDVYDSGYSWQAWDYLTGAITIAKRRMRSYTKTYHRDEDGAITAIQGGFTGSTHNQIADFLWVAVKVDIQDYVQVYP